MKILLAIVCALTIGCANATNEEFKERLNSDSMQVWIKFYDDEDIEELQAICGEGTAGCAVCNEANTSCAVFSIKSQCVIEHEMDHVFFGSYHGEGATCIVRALGGDT